MNPRMFLPLFSLLVAMFVVAGSKAEASDVHVSIGGGHHYYRGGEVVRYRTVDPDYTTWYPDHETVYVAPPVYDTTTVYDSYPYVYSSPSVDFGVWFGSDGRRHYGRHRR